MLDQIRDYIESKGHGWSYTSQQSENSRLNKVAHIIKDGPLALYKHLNAKGQKPYTIKTTFIRVADFMQWRIDEKYCDGKNAFKFFMKVNGRLFKNAYEKERLDVGYEEAVRRISGLADGEVKTKAFDLLATGMRYTESLTEANSTVIGKGGKRRRIYRPNQVTRASEGSNYTISYTTFYNALKAIGLKPHTLRKLALNRFVENGAKEADLMAIAGWSSIATASSYLQPKREEELDELVSKSFHQT